MTKVRQTPETKWARGVGTDNQPRCRDCHTPFTSSDQYASSTDMCGRTKYWCAAGYGCRENRVRSDRENVEGVRG